MSDIVDVVVARPEDRPAIEHQFQLYTHDFSEQWTDTPRGELGEDGLFEAYPLDPYWSAPNHVPLLLKHAGHPIGFALLNDHGHSGQPVDWNMAEFFVVRKHRRGGVGTAAARAIFNRYPGQWEAAVARANRGALSFWRNAVRGQGRVEGFEELDVNTPDWNGYILRFRIKPGVS
jgi:predicted acetyltransferase